MSTARISVNIDEDIKLRAQKILGEIGLDMTTAIDLLLRTIIREERIPFELRTAKAARDAEDEAYRLYVYNELQRAKIEAADPKTKWRSFDEVVNELQKRHEARTNVLG